MNREQIGKFLILRELQHKENVGKLNEKGKDVLLMLQFDKDNLNNKDMKEVLEFIDNLEANQNQKAIECLKNCEYYLIDLLAGNYDNTLGIILAYIENKIKELEENNES